MRKHVYLPLGSIVHSYGTQPAAATSVLLEDSVLGVVAYRYAMRWKSGIIAAYQAHAMPVLLLPHKDELEPEPPEPGDWCFSTDQLLALDPGSLVDMQNAATAGHRSYQRFRSSHSMVETILPALLQQTPLQLKQRDR
jgi:hypothetical protein